jgi:hypothetical protein
MSKRNQLVLSLVTGATLAVGCSARERAEHHEKRAREEAQNARDELRKGDEKAQRELIEARKKANEDFRDAREERAKASEARSEERQPVAGRDRDENDGKPTSEWIGGVRDKLGNDWAVERQPTGVLAIRKHPVRRDADFHKKLDDEFGSLRDDQKGVDASVIGDEVRVRGTFDHCRNLAKWTDKLADVRGINRIFIDAACKD